MGQWYCADLPTLGKESLGVWLSDWPWNSIIGKERWQEGFIMDICRGSMLAQPWSDEKWLTPTERKEMALFIDLLKAQPNCFRNSKWIYGNPWKNEPYGYCCSDGKRAFLAINNASWEDAVLPLELNAKWGLPEGEWEIARWYPSPARLEFDGKPTIALRPYEAVLLEAYPKGEKPTLARRLSVAKVVKEFEEVTVEISVKVAESKRIAPLVLLGEGKKGKKSDATGTPVSTAAVKKTDTKRVLVIKGRIPATAHGGTVVITLERLKKGHLFQTRYLPKETALEIAISGKSRKAAAVLGEYTFPSAWQVWKTIVPARETSQEFEAHMTVKAPKDIDCRVRVRWLPE